MKKLIIIAFVMLVVPLTAQVRIGKEDALSTAKRFLKENAKESSFTLTLNEVVSSRLTGDANLFVFSMEPRGFVIVSARNEVMAYSLSSELPSLEMGPFAYWIDTYNDCTDYLIEHPERARKATGYSQEVAPMLTSCWGQGCFHNEACPVFADGPCGHASAGCVAVAMAQIMYYHKFPMANNDTTFYSCKPNGDLPSDLGNTIYHWEQMTDTLHESNPAVATLIHNCGLSVAMNYGAQQSSAGSTDAAEAFCRYFYYPEAKLTRRRAVDDEEWYAMIKEDLDARLPVYFAGGSYLGRHAFVCDGYDSNGLFHFNFGWDGVADGYYTIDSPYGFSNDQLIIHVTPFMAAIHIEKEICEGDSYYFYGNFITEPGHYTAIRNKKAYHLELTTKPLPVIHCSNDTTIAYGSGVLLSASGADSYLWSTGDTTASIWVSPEKEDTYFVTGYSSNGCHVDARIKVYVDTTKKLLLYPNPASEKATVNMHEIDEVDLYDLFGKCVAHVDAHRHAVELDLSKIPNGVYIVEVKHLKNRYYDKLIVCH